MAERLGLSLIDIDALVEEDCGSSIPELWEREGEEGFRSREQKAIREAARGHHVVATGGGAVTDPSNVELMRGSGLVVFLKVGVPELTTRVGVGAYRPLLAGGTERQLHRIWKEREKSYRAAAHHVVDGEGEPEEVADRVAEACGI